MIVSYKVDRPSIRLNSPDVKAGGHVIQGRWPFVYSRDGMVRRQTRGPSARYRHGQSSSDNETTER